MLTKSCVVDADSHVLCVVDADSHVFCVLDADKVMCSVL